VHRVFEPHVDRQDLHRHTERASVVPGQRPGDPNSANPASTRSRSPGRPSRERSRPTWDVGEAKVGERQRPNLDETIAARRSRVGADHGRSDHRAPRRDGAPSCRATWIWESRRPGDDIGPSPCCASAIPAVRPRLVIRVGGPPIHQRSSFSRHGRTFLCARDRLYFASPGVSSPSA
jgi:hypothetical protein